MLIIQRVGETIVALTMAQSRNATAFAEITIQTPDREWVFNAKSRGPSAIEWLALKMGILSTLEAADRSVCQTPKIFALAVATLAEGYRISSIDPVWAKEVYRE